jgi:hypothetical protein
MNIPDFSKKVTMEQAFGPAMKITDQTEADEYFEALVRFSMDKAGKTREEAEKIQKSNLGYYSGYYDQKTQVRVQKLFNCVHPIFGAIEESKSLTAEDYFKMGERAGERIKKGKSIEMVEQPKSQKKSTKKSRKILWE